MNPLIHVTIFVWASCWAANSLLRMQRGDYSLVHPVLLVSYLFVALPLGYDVLWGLPDLSRFPGMAEGMSDPHTRQMYLLYVALIPPLLMFAARFRSFPPCAAREGTIGLPAWLNVLARLVLWSPIVVALFSPEPKVYLGYAISQADWFAGAVADHHALVMTAGRLSIVAGIALLLSIRRFTLVSFLWVLVPMLGTAWLNGKRSAVAMIIAGVLFAVWQRGFLKGRGLVIAGAMAGLALGVFSIAYQSEFRSGMTTATSYEGFRIDYGRDSQIRMELFAEQEASGMSILEYRGQTVPMYALQYVPRAWWPDKPLPYAQYFTSAVFGASPREWGWGITTSWYGEWVSNIGVSAFFIAPLALGLLCRWGDKVYFSLARASVMVVLILLVVQHVSAFYALVPVSIGLVLWGKSLARPNATSGHYDSGQYEGRGS